MKNPCGKTVKAKDAYEVWRCGDWTWYVKKKYQADDNKPYARAFCLVVTPIVPEGELGDVYIADYKNGIQLDKNALEDARALVKDHPYA